MVGRRQPTRACTDNQHSLAAGRPQRWNSHPRSRARSPGTAQPSASRPRCRGWRRYRRSRTGGSTPPVDRGKRIVGHERKPGQARARPPACGQATPGCSRPPGSPPLHGGGRSTYTGRSSRTCPTRERQCRKSGNGAISGRRAVISPAPRSEARTADSCGRFTKQSHLAGWDGVALSCNSPHLPPIGRLSALCCLRRYLADLLCAPPDPVFVRLRRTGADYKLENLRTGVPSSRRSELSRQIRT